MRKRFVAAAAVMLAVAAALYFYYYARPVHIVAAGDILLSRGVYKYLEEYGYDYPYTEVKAEVMKGDITLANLECPLTDSGNAAFKRPDLIFKGSRLNGAALKAAGFDLLNLANNHSMDYGREGLADTLQVLDSCGILAVGAGATRSEARKPVFIKKGRAKIGFLGYSDFPPEGYIYDENKGDVARADIESLGEEVKAAGERCDFLVVSFHWGKEFDNYPGDRQREMAHTAVENGADLILGHHPHVLQSMEKYKGKLIFYSLGNFVFDRQLPGGSDESVMVDVTVDGEEWKEARLVPIKINGCKPSIARGEEAGLILGNCAAYSENRGVEIVIDGDAGFIRNEK